MNSKYMKLAYREALKAYNKNEVPVGCVIVCDDKIVSKAHNDREAKHRVLGHAEINAIIKASKKIGDWRLDNCEMYVTLIPCEMCQSIINESRIKKVYYLLNCDKIKTNYNYITQTNVCQEILDEYKTILKGVKNKFIDEAVESSILVNL